MFIRSRSIVIALFAFGLFTWYFWQYPAFSKSHEGPRRRVQQGNFTVDAVIVQLKHENTAWIPKFFPDWNHKFYIVNDPKAALTVPKNKGRESMAYLTYIIDNYDDLPDHSLFLHSERFQWHNDDPDYDGYGVLSKFRFEHLKDEGYVSLRCAWSLGCPFEIRPYADLNLPGDTKAPNRAYKKSFEELFPGVEVPNTIGASCCAQFAVSKERILSRPKSDYIRYRDWLVETDLIDYVSGRIMEYSWHIIFGKEAIHCPDVKTCYCKLFGLCDLDCDESGCKGRYILPPYSTLPKGWPRVHWNGGPRPFAGPD